MSQTPAVQRPANRLVHETSPYLLQHAHNPVDWWPWSEEAFGEARRRDVPILLSIGYSTCYWCHVMERESFENEVIARQMSDNFVCIKVDREERPDVDELYMAATVTMTGHGGWPMTVFLEPRSLRPFWCGTYFPATPMAGLSGRPTLPQILSAIADAWRTQRGAVEQQAAELGGAVASELAERRTPVELHPGYVTDAVGLLLRMHDRINGGFGSAPKFPQPVFIEFLLDVREIVDAQTREAIDAAVRTTLDRMMLGGLQDQVGGGFHRYCVDATWTVPHFEKMLYDNAQLTSVYARAAAAYDDDEYRRTVARVITYISREMTSPHGAFWSAQDAEVDGREGLNYVWTRHELGETLGAEDAAFAARLYGVDEGPNFRDPHHPDEPARSVLRLRERLDRIAAAIGIAPEEFALKVRDVNSMLYQARLRRPQPRLDDKIIAAWNGMMAAALATAGRLLDEPAWIDQAEKAVDWVTTRLRDDRGQLIRSYRGRPGSGPATLEDYGHLIAACTALAEAGRSRWLDEARRLAEEMTARLARSDGGFSDVASDRPDLFAIPRSTHDGAMPAGASTAVHALLGLASTGDTARLDQALAALAAISGAIAASPVGSVNATRALVRVLKQGIDRPGLISRVGSGEADGDRENPNLPKFLPLEIYAGTDRVSVANELPAKLRLLVKIADGHHAIAADPGPDAPPGLIPFRLHVIAGGGVEVYADYPPGELYGSPASGTVLVYRGTFELEVVVERAGAWKGRPLIAATYQTCTSESCAAPTTVELDVAIDPG